MKSTFLGVFIKSEGAFHEKRMLSTLFIMSFRVITKYRSFDKRKTNE